MANESTFDDASRRAHLTSGQVITNFHRSFSCFGATCPVHNPSDHEMRDWDLHYDDVVGSFFRSKGSEYTIDPDDYTFNRTGQVILRNSIECSTCRDEIESTHRHDYVLCQCEAVAVDGGHVYLRRVGYGTFTDTSIVFQKE